MTNFDFLKLDPGFDTFADVAISAEKLLHIDIAASVINCRRAMEFAIKWMYSVDKDLEMPYDERLQSLMDNEDFRSIVGEDLLFRMTFIRKRGNDAAHGGKTISKEQAELCIENLFYFLDFVACCYAKEYKQNNFDKSLLSLTTEEALSFVTEKTVDLEDLIKENQSLKDELTARRAEQQQSYVPKPLDLSEFKTRKLYIDAMLDDAGWIEGKNWINEVELLGMPNKSEVGYADYVLYDDTHKPLAVVEAKRTCKDPKIGRQQAKLYADILENQYGRRPAIFLTNGFETRLDDGQYPERKVSTIYSKRDLEKMFNLRRMRTSLKNVMIDKEIAGRYYQEGAIKAVCDAFDRKNRRKALLVMATGSGKTRTVIALCKVLLEHGWVKNILFLADRTSLVTQAKRSFVNLLPDLSVTNLCEEKDSFAAHCVFSTYQTMYNCIDEVKDDEGKLFTSGHFDLLICDEAHRSIYNKYKDIFNYFDAPLVGLTATPKDEIDKNTYEIFELESGVPTYGYELAQAVKDGYLVDFMSVESKFKFIEEGITYADLSEEEKEEYENKFADDNGEIPDVIGSAALNEWIFNRDTIRQVLDILMSQGLKIDYGEKVGKTIIFAKNHRHAEEILEVFNSEYPNLKDFARVIDNQTKYAQNLIDEFSDPKKLPQIAISVDMLDTGIDVPEILNLVFFKKVMSKAKFWQMIGRGTRLCEGLLDGEDKCKFYIFDFCGNFEFFRMNEGKASANQMTLQGAIFNLKAQIAFKLQDLDYQSEELITFRKRLVSEMAEKARELNKENFAVKQHLKYVELYANEENYVALTYADTLLMREELSPLITADKEEASAVRFDALMYGIELAYLAGKSYSRHKSDLLRRISAVSKVGTIPEVAANKELIEKILKTSYVDSCDVNEFEHIRKSLRDLMKYIPSGERLTYKTNFADDILSTEWRESELESDDLKNYRVKAEFYVRQHQENNVIAKLRSNIPLTKDDLAELEKILWSEIGSKEDYAKEYGEKPLGEFVREIVGLDMNAAKEAFSEFLNNTNLDSRQIYFVNQIVEYIVHNGMMKDLSVLQEPPFTDKGSVVEVFTDLSLWAKVRKVIEQININAVA
ncbi:MAG: DEAD/DEAH box helicase family protein [Oscillospiraceae bacterium]|nr:DEAD/DEAH box helicase family protein [Oscillospiraceae bacterium]